MPQQNVDPVIETPLASPRYSGDSSSVYEASSIPSARESKSFKLPQTHSLAYRLGFGLPDAPVQPHKNNIYDSIHNLEQHQKIEALKDNKLDPTQIQDPYDGLAHAFHLWKTVAAKAQKNPNISFTEQRKIADNFYDGLLAPLYAKAELSPLDRELWQKQAYGQALNYNIEDAYGNSWLQSLRHGWNSGLAATARGALQLSNILGNTVDDAVTLWKNRAEAAKLTVPSNVQGKAAWYYTLADLHNKINTTPHTPPELGNAVTRGALVQSQNRQFWADAIPARDGFINKATDFTVEQVAQAPVFAALALGGEAIGAAGGSTLTARLTATPAGRHAMGYLFAGSEGLAYGAAVHKQNDPGEMYRDAIGFMTMHGLFDVGGMGLKKLIDLFPSDSKEFAAMKARQDQLMLRLYGTKEYNPVEKYDLHKTETANNIAAVGIPGQVAIHADGLEHVAETEKMSPKERVEYEKRLLEEDLARWAPVLSASKFIRSLVPSGKSISELSKPELNFIRERLQTLTLDAASEMNTRVKGMDEENIKAAQKNLKQPSAKHTLDYYVMQAKKELAKTPGAESLVGDDAVMKAAQKQYAKDLQAAAEHAEKEAGQSKVSKAQNIGKRVKRTKLSDAITLKTRTRETSSGRYVSVSPQYKVQYAKHLKAAKAKGMNLTEWFKDLSDEDFEKDLSEFFYPKALRQAKIFFEHQNTREGMQNPNFLAFMYNYTNKMPKEFADELKERLINTMKVQKFIKGRNITEPQLDYFAKAMYNHVDNFLGSGRWPEEHNIFRSSNENMFHTTEWQRELLVEKMVEETNILKDAFSGEPKVLRSAMSIYGALSQARMAEFKRASIAQNSQHVIRSLDDQIADLLTQTKKYERWIF
jgi:hypothetical protein